MPKQVEEVIDIIPLPVLVEWRIRLKNWIKRHKVAVIVIGLALFAVIAAVILVPRMMRGNGEAKEQETKQNTIELAKMDLSSSVSATGTIESATTKIVSANVSNVKVKKVLVKEGDEVTKGQSLLTFDESDLQSTLDDAEDSLSDVKTQNSNELTAAKRKLTEAQETYSSQKKKLAAAVASAKSDYQTAKKAVSEAATAAEKSQAQEKLSQAKSAYEQAKQEQETGNKQNKSSVQSAKDAITTTQTNNKKSLREAERSVEDAREALEACSVTAPIAGTVTAIGVEAGDTYSGGDLIEISDCANLQVSTSVDEYDISDVEEGQKVVILTDATGEEELEGRITYVAKTMGSSFDSSGASGSSGSGSAGTISSTGTTSSSSGYEVRIKLNSTNDKLRIGMTAKCSIIKEEAADVYAVPYDAIHTNTNGDTVLYVMDSSGMRSEVAVTKGMESDYYVEVSGEGLSDGLQVIIPTDSTSSSSDKESSSGSLDGLMGGGKQGGDRGGRGGGGGAPGGMPGM